LKSQRFEKRQWIRWSYVIACLLFLIYVSHQVILIACAEQDRQLLEERSGWISMLIVRQGQIDLSSVGPELTDYGHKKNVRIAIYNSARQPVYTSDSKRDPNSADWKPFRLSERFAYSTTPIRADHRTIGYLELQSPRTVIVGLGLFYWLIFLSGIGLLFYRDFLVHSYKAPVRFAANMAENMLDGKYTMIASDSERHNSVLRLNLALNRLSESLHEINRSYTEQRDSMETLIENIGSGLIFIDGNGRIDYVNQTFKDDFKTEAAHWEFAEYQEVIPYPEINEMIAGVYRDKKRAIRQVQLPVAIERKHFDVSCAPILDKRKKVRGIVAVFHDITSLKRLENVRRDFVANVSHELKTPITSLIGFTETLLDGAKDDKQLEKQFLNIMLHEARRLQDLVRDLLDLSKIEREHFSIDWQTVSLAKVMDAVLLIFKEKADAKKIHLIRSPGDEGWALGDPFRIRQIMINLISNAIAYTPEGGTVRLTISEKEDTSTFTIADNGMGIEKEQIPRIFERFYRVDKARSRDSGGTGLGLAIVKHLVEAHKGHIEVQSEPGKGTTFVIYFRKASPPNG
jgi:two-component system phosphate regulon sensor histidine kinase PhoR